MFPLKLSPRVHPPPRPFPALFEIPKSFPRETKRDAVLNALQRNMIGYVTASTTPCRSCGHR